MQKKPIMTSTSSFEKIVTNGGLYVDKTKYFHRLVTSADACYFCSRPRRFGKSLAISTFENIFLGRKELFKGFFIADTDYDWEIYPVVRLDMSKCDASSSTALSASIHEMLLKIADSYDVGLRGEGIIAVEFDSLISALHKKTGKGVVVLIDEYDHPLTENINNADTLESVRNVLETFYKIIKAQEANERFVFMTGVTKFSKVSVFSKLNNLTDITMTREYACMFGYTQKEMEGNFASYIEEYVQEKRIDRVEFVEKIKKWYNGFRFDYESTTVYNPVSIGQFFMNGCRFQNYWFNTATPTLIANLAKKQRLEREDIEEAVISDTSLNIFDIADFASNNITKSNFIIILFQTGYLTIGKSIDAATVPTFTVHFPNFEVENSFENILFTSYCDMPSDIALSYVSKIIYAASEGKVERLEELFKNFLSEIPYTIQIPEEKYYQTIIFCILKMCGMEVDAENATNKGRIDAVMDTPRIVYIFEFKINKSRKTAERQIMKKEYFQKFIEYARDTGKEIKCIGLNFSTKEKNIVG